MPYIAETTIRELNDKLDAVSVVNDYVRLEKKGGRYWGLCPFHHEKTGSFTVNPDMKWYHCFGCGKSGSVIDFVMEMDKFSFPEAVEHLAKQTGVEVAYESGGRGAADTGREKERDQLFELYRRVAVSFHHFLLEKPEGAAAKQYIISRGINDEMLDRFRLGYAPGNRNWLHRFLTEKGYSPEFLASSGLFSKNRPQSAFFFDRLMFPIADRQGRTVAFGGRVLAGDGPKYLNSGESGAYKKRETLYAIDLALPEIRKTREAYIAEGYLDVIALHQAGITNAVAPLGTAFTDEQAKLLKRWAERVFLIFDADEAGQNAAFKGIMTCRKNGLESCVAALSPEDFSEAGGSPAPKDPADILKNFGPEALQKSVKKYINDFDYLIKRSKSLFDLSDSLGKSRAAAFLFPYARALDSEVSRDSCLGVIADALGVERQAVASDFSRFSKRQDAAGQGIAGFGVDAPAARRSIGLNDELFLLIAVLVNHDLYPKLRSALVIDDFDDPAARELFIALEEWFRNDMPGLEDLKERISDEALRNFVIQQGVSEAFSMNSEKLVSDGIRKIRQKRLERRLAKIVTELRITKYEQDQGGGRGTALEDLLAEKVHLDAELRLLKEAN
ncbi:MAG: DNA primase [Treponema sp.]|jgi:DNA primase|nr:DNA primase [Treponema sp.]